MCIRFFQLCFVFFTFPCVSQTQNSCKSLFEGSLRQAQLLSSSRAEAFDKNLPKFVDIIEESTLEKFWSSKAPNPDTLTAFLPKGVSFVSHRLRESQESYLVKFPAAGSAMIARAQYESQGQSLETNVSFSKEGLIDNLGAEKKWLAGPKSRAAILFLHGGGTKSTGGHVAESIINHFQKHNVTVISPDLPWHAEGPRTFMGTLDQEMLSLADLAKKYIHPDVPLFIWGHSWGGTFAHRIMQMTGEREEGFFHKSLKGLIITSPAVDPAPDKSLKEKKKAFFTRIEEGLKREDEWAPNEGHIFQQMVLDGKTSPTGQFFASLTLAELNDKIPEHKGKNYLPALMIVGNGDSMVYLGFEDLFHNYYDQLENVEAHYLEKLPLIISNNQKKPEKVGHLLSDYLGPKGKYPVNFELAFDFINKHTVEKPRLNKDKLWILFDMLNIMQLWSNDLSFREWTKNSFIMKTEKTDYFKKLKQELNDNNEILLKQMYQYSPSAHLIKSLETVDKDNFSEIKEQIKPLERFFSNQSSLYAFLKSETVEESLLASEKLLKTITEQAGKKYQQQFRRNIYELIKADSTLKSVKEKYAYLSNTEIQEIKAFFQKSQKLEQKLQELYIPSAEDYKNQGYLTDEQIYKKIYKITDNSQKRSELKKQIKTLQKDITVLEKQFNVDIDKVQKIIKQLKLILEEAFSSPPDFLKAEFENSEKEFLAVYAFSEKMGVKLEEESLNTLKEGSFSLKSIHNHLDIHRPMIDEFNRKYDTFIQNRKKLRQAVIQAIKQGKFLSKEKDHIRKELYEETGLYYQLNQISQLLAEKEVEKHELFRLYVELSEEYNRLLPYPDISKSHLWPVADLLNLSNFNQELLEENKLQFQQILKNWKSLSSQVLPSLPD